MKLSKQPSSDVGERAVFGFPPWGMGDFFFRRPGTMSSDLHQLGEHPCERGECGSTFETLQVPGGGLGVGCDYDVGWR